MNAASRNDDDNGACPSVAGRLYGAYTRASTDHDVACQASLVRVTSHCAMSPIVQRAHSRCPFQYRARQSCSSIPPLRSRRRRLLRLRAWRSLQATRRVHHRSHYGMESMGDNAVPTQKQRECGRRCPQLLERGPQVTVEDGHDMFTATRRNRATVGAHRRDCTKGTQR